MEKTKCIQVTLRSGEQFMLKLNIPANADEWEYICGFLDSNIPDATEWV